MPFVGLEIQLGTCMFTGIDEDGFPVAQADANGTDPRVAPSDLHHPFGFASRPRDPDLDADGQLKAGGGCVLFYAVDGDATHMWLGADPRYVSTFPQLKKGGSMQYCAPGSFSIFDGDDGTLTTYVPVPNGALPPTKAHAITVGVDGNGEPTLTVQHADGMAIVMFDRKIVLKNSAGDAYIELGDSGTVLNGNTRLNGGLIVGDVVGAQPLVPAPALLTLLATLAAAIDSKTGPVTTTAAAVAAAAATLSTTLTRGT